MVKGRFVVISAVPFSVFRFVFGLLMIPQVLGLSPFIHGLSKSTFVFHYPYLSFIDAYSHGLITVFTVLAVIGAILLALGLYARVASLLFFVSFGYLFLIDRTFYNNHYYLWCLISFLFMLSPSDAHLSIVDIIKGKYSKQTTIDTYIPFVLLLSIVYLFGGLVKLNMDWLNGQPMRLMMHSRGLAQADFLGYFVSYTGVLFDLFIWVFLLWMPKKWYVYIPYFVFHLSNYFIFNIGEFPLVMIAGWMLFLPFDKISISNTFLSWCRGLGSSFSGTVLGAFFVFQIIWPLRAYFIEGNTAWNRQGYYFSWRMMLNNHQSLGYQYLVDMPDIGKSYHVDFSKMLTPRQYSNTYHDPYHIWLLAQKLKTDATKKYASNDVKVYCRSIISLNDHQPELLLYDTVDIASVNYSLFKHNDFITSPTFEYE